MCTMAKSLVAPSPMRSSCLTPPPIEFSKCEDPRTPSRERASRRLLRQSLQAPGRPKPAIRLSRKDWLLRADRALLCPVLSAVALRDPALPASPPRWGFGGGGDGRHTNEGDPDAQDKVQEQICATRERQQDQDPERRKANDRSHGHTSQTCYKAGGSAGPVRVAADCTPRKQKGTHHCNVASAGWRDHRGDSTCSEMATPLGPWLPRRCRAQEARPHACLVRRREWARLPDCGSHGISGGVKRCGSQDWGRRRQPDCRWTTRPRICAISISMACGRAGRACSGNSHPLICLAICCSPFSSTGSRPTSWAISIPQPIGC